MYYNTKESGERIRQLRLETGLTQERTANALNIDRSFYSRIESGKNGCSVDLLIQLSTLFNVSIDYLVLGKSHRMPSSNIEGTLLKRDIEKLIVHLEKFCAVL